MFFKLLEHHFNIELLTIEDSSAASSFCSASLGWRDFGNPRKEESNTFLMQPIAVAGVLTPIAEIGDERKEQLSDSEYRLFESIFTQLYLFTRKPSAETPGSVAAGNETATERKRKAACQDVLPVGIPKL